MTVPRDQLLVGDVRTLLPTIPDQAVDCVITSPPYYRLRNYDTPGQIGLEPSVDSWADELRVVLREVARVLKPTGSLWLNLGDSYSRDERFGALPKSLLLGPERLALAMVEDGWIIRSKIIWSKTNAMPTSVRDRLACTWEVFYLAVRSRAYFFDLDAIRIPHRSRLARPSEAARRRARIERRAPEWAGPLAGSNNGLDKLKARGLVGHPLGKNPGDVWTVPTSNFRGEHHAGFPLELIRTPLLAGCPERVCVECGAPWERTRARTIGQIAMTGELRAVCACGAGVRPGLVLDPFMGAGTVAVAAEDHGRDWLGIEISPAFARLARERINGERTKRAAARAEGKGPMAA